MNTLFFNLTSANHGMINSPIKVIPVGKIAKPVDNLENLWTTVRRQRWKLHDRCAVCAARLNRELAGTADIPHQVSAPADVKVSTLATC